LLLAPPQRDADTPLCRAAEYARNEPLNVGMDKYDSWFVRNVTVSEENWGNNETLQVGRGEEADLITLGPIFDPRGSGWFWEYDVQSEWEDEECAARR
jgi:hypothetical protein